MASGPARIATQSVAGGRGNDREKILFSPIDEIKNKLDVVEVISGYIKLQKAGRNFRAICPFHAEKTPSFMVSPERQIWHCFGCGKGGDIFGFVKEIEGLEFGDTLRLLAQRAGVILKKQDPRIRTEKQRLLEICELSAKFFEKQFADSMTGEKIKKYLLDRGINKNSIAEWRIGFAPDDWRALSNFIKSRGYKDQEIINSGVVVERTGVAEQSSASTRSSSLRYSTYYDRFRNRIIFPIFDINGQIVGFAGRVAPGEKEETAKYINTSQTLIYDKGRILYGLNLAKVDIRTKDHCVMVEGNTDVIMSRQAGFKNTIASSGTALTNEHLKIVKRYTNNLILGFDMDAAGDMATKRAIDLALLAGFNVKIISVVPGNGRKVDPADIIKENPKKWEKALAQATGIIEFYFQNAFAKFNPKEVNGKKEIARIILPLLKKIPDKIEQNYWVQELAQRLKTSEKVIIDAMRSIKSKAESAFSEKKDLPQKAKNIRKNRLGNLEEEIIAFALNSPNIKKILAEIRQTKGEFTNPSLAVIFQKLEEQAKKSAEFNLAKWQSKLPDELRIFVEQLLFKLEIQQLNFDHLEGYVKKCLEDLKKEKIRLQLNNIQMEIKEYERVGDKKKLNACLQQFRQLAAGLSE